MTIHATARRGLWLLRVAGSVTLVLIAVSVVTAMGPEVPRWGAALLLALVVVLFVAFTRPDPRTANVRIYLVAQSLLVLTTFGLEPASALGVSQIFYLLTIQAALFLRVPEASAWAAFYAAVTLLGGIDVMGWGELMSVVAAAGANVVFLGLGAALRQLRLANARSRRLVAELRSAHAQLQQLTEQAQQVAVLEERERIGREMHDALGHRLTVAVVQLEGAAGLIDVDPQRAEHIVVTARDQLRSGLAELRDAVASVRTPSSESLAEALRRLAAAFAAATGLATSLHAAGDLPPTTDEARHALYRVVQEALTNAQRHASATKVDIDLAAIAGELRVRVRDDGVGFSVEPPRTGYGLTGVAERVASLGGRMRVRTRPSGGAELEAFVPVAQSATSATNPGAVHA